MERLGELPLGSPLPPLHVHAITVSIPTWKENVAYQEGEPAAMKQLHTGYPRFVIHAFIIQLSEIYLREEGKYDDEQSFLFPIANYAKDCVEFMLVQSPEISRGRVRQSQFIVNSREDPKLPQIVLHVVSFPKSARKVGMRFWQHTGFGISSRLAQRCLNYLGAPFILSPSRYGTPSQWGAYDDGNTSLCLSGGVPYSKIMSYSASKATQAKLELRKRLADLFSRGDRQVSNCRTVVHEDDVFLYPAGMTAIWHAHQLLMTCWPNKKFVCFGFPYTDTLKILEKWGPGCYFFGHDVESDMSKLENLLSSQSVQISALFCEITSNPRLESPPFDRLRALADKYNFLIVVDDTIGTSVNVNVLPYADIITTSLSKFVCGYANALGGSLVLNPRMRFYQKLKEVQLSKYIDVFFDDDAVVMERNSRSFESRMRTINANTNALCEFLRLRSLMASPLDKSIIIKEIFYPKWSARIEYDICRVTHYQDGQLAEDNFGGLFSLIFVNNHVAQAFFDALPCAKGPSLGTVFTLVCPYTILAHYAERKWAAEYGVEENLVRVSVGVEEREKLLEDFEFALKKAEAVVSAECT